MSNWTMACAAFSPIARETVSMRRAAGAELIVVDGGSSDGSADIAASYADRVLDTPRGRAGQMNAGAAAARAEVLLFLHADTRLPESAEPAILQAIAGGRPWGRFDVRIEGNSAWLPLVRQHVNYET